MDVFTRELLYRYKHNPNSKILTSRVKALLKGYDPNSFDAKAIILKGSDVIQIDKIVNFCKRMNITLPRI